MKKMRTIRMALLGMATLAVVALPNLVSAATDSGSSNGMKVSPVRTDLVINPGESKSVTIFLQNVTSSDGAYKAVFDDFQARDETGTPGLNLDGKANPAHGLKKYATFSPNLTLKAGENGNVKVTLTIPKDAAGGGYYGAIRFVPAQQPGGKSVSLTGSVASLILVRVPGNITEQVQVASMDVRKDDKAKKIFTTGSDLSAVVRFRNSGNVQEQPFGKVLLKKGGKVLGTYEINNTQPKGNLLPDSIRKFDVKLTNVGSFGKYTLEGNFGYGTKGDLLSATTSFYVVPVFVLLPAIVLSALVVLAIIVAPKMLKRYKKRILRSAGRR
jgi:hypothetical protein